MHELDILYEDNHLLVINKPAGIATMGSESGPTIHSLAADYLKQTYDKPGRAYVGIVSRLDAMTSGVLVLARTSKAASRLTPQFAAKDGTGAAKLYLAAVEGYFDSDEGCMSDHLRKNDHAKRTKVVDAEARGAKLAELRYLTLARSEEASLLAVQLLSGRKHQVRVQFSHRRHCVVGDRKYGARSKFPAGVALHSWRLQITHPTRRERLWFEAPPPHSWKRFSRLLPGIPGLRRRVAEHFNLPADSLS